MQWAAQPTIGTNAGGSPYNNHPLTGKNYAFRIGCVHTGLANDTNNIVYSLVPNPDAVMPIQTQPPYHNTIGEYIYHQEYNSNSSSQTINSYFLCIIQVLVKQLTLHLAAQVVAAWESLHLVIVMLSVEKMDLAVMIKLIFVHVS